MLDTNKFDVTAEVVRIGEFVNDWGVMIRIKPITVEPKDRRKDVVPKKAIYALMSRVMQDHVLEGHECKGKLTFRPNEPGKAKYVFVPEIEVRV